MAKDFDAMEDSNRSSNPSIHEVSDPARRTVLRGGAGVAVGALLAPLLPACANPTAAAPGGPLLGFKGVPVSASDTVVVPDGYVAEAIAAWGEPIGVPGHMPPWREDAGNSAADQALQMGMHHDGIHFYPLAGSSTRGVLAMNHEYTDDGLLHPGGLADWSAEKVHKAQAAHGVGVIEVALQDGRWQMVRPSPYARRFTATTPFAVGGPAAGHPLFITRADPAGRTVLGTFNNCASGQTPWGTYLSGEENWAGYFAGGETIDADQRRWGLRKTSWYRWAEFDERFDAAANPNEFHRHGWIVEIDPLDPASTPVKRTALGRAAHEGAWVAVTKDGRAVVYSGEDARFEYIYKFVSRDRIAPGGANLTKAQANRELLDHGTLYVARFDADGGGRWLPLVHGQGPLTAANGFADQGAVVIRSRQASDLLGGTKMDRPEWLAIDQARGEVFCTLTNNSARGQPGFPGVDAANPRANNAMGHIIRWKEDGDFDAVTMRWDHLVLAGDPANARAEAKGNVRGDVFGCPDGLCDRRARRVVDPDRREFVGAAQGRVRTPRQQPDARLRPRQRRDPPLPDRAGRLRDHRRGVHAGRAHDVHQHPAPGRDAERSQRPGRAAPLLELARPPAGRAAAFGHRRDPPPRRRRDRHLSRPQASQRRNCAVTSARCSSSRWPVSGAIHWRSGAKSSARAGSAWRPSALSSGTRPSPSRCYRLAVGRPERGRHREAGDLARQGQGHAAVGAMGESIRARPVLVEQVAVAQVGDAGAAQPAQARERRGIGRRAQQRVDPLAGALERRAVVRGAEEDHVAHATPASARPVCVAWCIALRSTRPPMLWPISTMRSRGTGQAVTRSSRRSRELAAVDRTRGGRCCSAGRRA